MEEEAEVGEQLEMPMVVVVEAEELVVLVVTARIQ